MSDCKMLKKDENKFQNSEFNLNYLQKDDVEVNINPPQFKN